MTTELANEGFGTNQLVFLLAKIHRDGTEVVCIEEPEIHLHPSAVARFVEHLVNTVKEPLAILRRHFVISTHSEHLVTSLLGLVATGRLQPEDLAIYYASRQRYEADFERCEVTSKGQVKGGLKGFYEAELEAVKNLLQTPESSV
jgi:predicted ATPase